MHAQSITQRAKDVARFNDEEVHPVEDEQDFDYVTYYEYLERPKFATEKTWRAAMREAMDLGYTGHAAFAVAADTMYDTYGYR